MTLTISIVIICAVLSSSFLTAALTHLLSVERRFDRAARKKAARLDEVPEAGYFVRARVAREAVNDSLEELGEEAGLITREHKRELKKELRQKRS